MTENVSESFEMVFIAKANLSGGKIVSISFAYWKCINYIQIFKTRWKIR